MTRTLQLVTTIVVLFFSVVAYGQENTVRTMSGTVQDEKGIPLPGITIIEKGTSNSTATNEQGAFTIKVKPNATLVFKSIGFISREITPDTRKVLMVTMKEDVHQLADVVVVGYGTQKKQAITGAVVTADLKTYDKVPVNNIMETLKGTVAGLNVGEANKAGSAPGFSIRGTSTFGNGAPLLVLDGTIFNGSIADLAPADIESVTVLKDASAAAVYGSRSGNGVILIESKKGSSVNGKPSFNFSTSYGTVGELNRLKVYDAQGYMQRLNDILNDAGTVVPTELTSNYLQTIEKANYNATPDHQPTLADPYSLFRQAGSNAKTSLSVSQKTDKMSYYLSGTMTDQKGVIVNDKFKQYSLRLNLESKVTDWLTTGIKSYYSYRDYPDARVYGNAGNNGSSSYLISPYANVYNADGSYNLNPQTTTSFVNPFLMIPTQAYSRSNNLNAILYGTVKVPWVEGLTYTATYSKTNNTGESGSFYNKLTNDGMAVNGKGSDSYSRGNATLLDHMVKYNRTIAGLHNIDLTLLYSDQKNTSIGQSLAAQGFDNDQLGYNRLQAGATQSVSTSASQSEQLGQMARLTYNYNQKYSVTGTFRRDGYSAFAANHKYGNFGSVGANWTISNENFMKNVSFINSLALRGSYGSNGNQTITPYQTLPKIGNNYYYYQGDAGYTYTQGINNLGNDDLLWESTVGFNGGIDFSVLNNRISGSVDAYLTKTHNLAFPLILPQSSGFSQITANAGEIRNKGIELNLNTVNIQKDKFNWTSNVAFSLNRNKFQHLLGDRNGDGVEDDIVSSNQFIGKSMSTVYGYKVIGMWQQADKDNGTIMAGFQPGTYKLLDVNGDGKITSDADRVFLGDSNPNFRWSLTNTFSYSNFSLLVYLNSNWGGNGYFINGSNTPQSDPYAANGAMNHPVYDYWTPANPNAEFPRPSFATKAAATAPKYYDRSFVQLQKIAFGYDASKYFKKYGVNGVNLSVSADNLGTYAPHWIGLDAATASGLTTSSIPSLRTLTMNLNLNF
ncbi:SusC/RagA family TonB-linked outer membrane protein [Solitalea koreensis]|uniref:TonB-linked outer membrane protein, SusC/RagA family n=1 Tax=Solitalea koreensis TaxID=543615 RepID=A0A521BYC3_9SPHI|nr:SusC/RagA family TonB-linked outer membrane protein [Solitalea koreensis]SMO52202.1 TonB-linked outer membrane protein, SusC/RagA family [Solitalea koreensis]